MTSAEIRRYYNAWEEYDRELMADGYYVPFRLVEHTLPYLTACRSILDVGCGTGFIGRSLRWEGWDGRLVGVDIAANRLAEARHHHAYTRLQLGNAYHLPGRGGYDAVVASAVLGLAGPRAFDQMVRQAKPGGIVSVAVADLRTNQVHHRRYQRVVAGIRRTADADLIAEFDLGTGYSDVCHDERYRLFILRKSQRPA